MALSPTLHRLGQLVSPLWQRAWVRRSAMAILIGLSLLFLALAIREASSAEMLSRISGRNAAVIGMAGVAYAALLGLLALAWSRGPASLTPGIGLRHAIAVYGTSILPKYIPGSILQYGSRQLLGMQLGWNQQAMVRASVLEVALHVLCSLTVAAVLLTPLLGHAAPSELFWYGAAAVVALVIAAALVAFLGRQMATGTLIGSVAYQLAFFVGLAALAVLCGAAFGVTADTLLPVGGLFLLSWLIGLVVPLAPGGLAVREAAGVALMSGSVGVETALLILVSMRIVSLIGDVLAFAAGLACQWALHLVPR